MLLTTESSCNTVKIRFVVVVKEGTRNWFPLHRELIGAVLHPGLVVDWHNEEGPLKEIKSLEDAQIMGEYVVRGAQEAERLGFDAVAVPCLLQPGVKEARERTRIPVIGAAEASLAVASKLGQKIAFVVGGDNTESLENVVRSLPGAEYVVRYIGIGGTPLDFSDMSKFNRVLERMEQGMRRAIEDGADVIIGYGSLPLICELRQRLAVPIVSPIQAVVLYAEHVARVRAAFVRQVNEHDV